MPVPIRLSLFLLSLFPYGYLCSCYLCLHTIISVLVIFVPIRLSLFLLSLFPYDYLCTCYLCSHTVISVLVISVPIRLSLFLRSLFSYGYLCSWAMFWNHKTNCTELDQLILKRKLSRCDIRHKLWFNNFPNVSIT